MAKEWARAFYKSAAWQAVRRQVLHRDMYTCEGCGGRAQEVHHEIELTPENIGDPAVTLNTALLHSLCHECHTKLTQRNTDCGTGYCFGPDGQLTPRGAM